MHVIVIQSCLTCNNVTMSSGHMGLFQTFLDFTVLLRPHQGVTGHRLSNREKNGRTHLAKQSNNSIIETLPFAYQPQLLQFCTAESRRISVRAGKQCCSFTKLSKLPKGFLILTLTKVFFSFALMSNF